MVTLAANDVSKLKPGDIYQTQTCGPIKIERVQERTSLSGPSYWVIVGTRLDDKRP